MLIVFAQKRRELTIQTFGEEYKWNLKCHCKCHKEYAHHSKSSLILLRQMDNRSKSSILVIWLECPDKILHAEIEKSRLT